MKQHRIARTGQMAAVLGLVLGMGLLAACRSHAQAADRPADTTAVQFPEASKASLKEGIYPDVADLRRFAPGMSKRQLYTLLGTPHFNEGMWGVREWNYLFNFRTAQGAEYFTCQFQVRFDSKGIAQGLLEAGIVRGGDRTATATGAACTGTAAGATPAAVGRRAVRIRQRGTQRRRPAGGAGHPGAGARGRAGAVDPGDRVHRPYRQCQLQPDPVAATCRGRTQRAGAGRVPAASISAEGRGAAEPIVQCEQRNRRELIACLAPNRRVQIAGIAQPR